MGFQFLIKEQMYQHLFTSSSSFIKKKIISTTTRPSTTLSFFISNRITDKRSMSSITTNISERYFADENTPFSRLEAKPFFETLSLKEKKYAHYMSRASFEGTRIIITQTNPNALPIYDMIIKTFSNEAGEMINSETLFQQRYVLLCFY